MQTYAKLFIENANIAFYFW